jgi:hypothetical protein
MEQVHSLEDKLGITEGHRKIQRSLVDGYLWKLRQWIWALVFVIAGASYFWVAYLFR